MSRPLTCKSISPKEDASNRTNNRRDKLITSSPGSFIDVQALPSRCRRTSGPRLLW